MKTKEKYSVYLVDDDIACLKALEHTISMSLGQNVKVESFSSGEECIRHLGNNHIKGPDVIILDYFLDQNSAKAINGLSTLKLIRTYNTNAEILMLSSNDEHGNALECIENGASDYFVKNESTFMYINNRISNIINSQRLKKATASYRMWNIILAISLLILGVSFLVS